MSHMPLISGDRCRTQARAYRLRVATADLPARARTGAAHRARILYWRTSNCWSCVTRSRCAEVTESARPGCHQPV